MTTVDAATTVGPPVLELTADVRSVLAERDIAGLYAALQRAGVSQRKIAALTGQTQSEVSEILAGRTFKSISVLERIVDGLRIPRSTIGLVEPDPSTQPLSVPAIPLDWRRLDETLAPRLPRLARRIVIGPDGPDVPLWTATEVWAFRQVARMSTREFARYLSVNHNTLARWEANVVPSPFQQSLLDTALRRSDLTIQSRFVRLMSGDVPTAPRRRRALPGKDR